MVLISWKLNLPEIDWLTNSSKQVSVSSIFSDSLGPTSAKNLLKPSAIWVGSVNFLPSSSSSFIIATGMIDGFFGVWNFLFRFLGVRKFCHYVLARENEVFSLGFGWFDLGSNIFRYSTEPSEDSWWCPRIPEIIKDQKLDKEFLRG